MLTVRAMSGMSHPIPAHLVLMSRQQVLEEKDENFANATGKDSTQLPRQPKHAPSPLVCCHHLSFSIEDASKQGSPRDPAFSFAQDAEEDECNRQKWCTSFEVFFTDWLLRISSSIFVSEWENIKSSLHLSTHFITNCHKCCTLECKQGSLNSFFNIATPPSHLQCSQYC